MPFTARELTEIGKAQDLFDVECALAELSSGQSVQAVEMAEVLEMLVRTQTYAGHFFDFTVEELLDRVNHFFSYLCQYASQQQGFSLKTSSEYSIIWGELLELLFERAETEAHFRNLAYSVHFDSFPFDNKIKSEAFADKCYAIAIDLATSIYALVYHIARYLNTEAYQNLELFHLAGKKALSLANSFEACMSICSDEWLQSPFEDTLLFNEAVAKALSFEENARA